MLCRLNFFSSTGFDPEHLLHRLPFFRGLDRADTNVWVHRKQDNLEAIVNRGGMVKVAFFGGLDTLQRVEDPRRAKGSRVRVALLVDLARTEGLHRSPHIMAAAKAIDRNFDPITSIRALQFYGDGTLNRVPPAIQRDLTRWAQAVDLARLPVVPFRRGLTPERVAP